MPSPEPVVRPEGSSKSRFRGDIQGMRAIAVLMVMLWHAGAKVLPGGFVGVDVFFVVSGYLMTAILLRDQDSSEGLSLVSFYARRARRLLPASLTTLVLVGVVGWWVLPPLRRWDLVTDIASSAAFGMNWRMSHQAVDYLAATTGPPSALQHFWSLGVEEQFYFVWPVLLLLAGLLARRLGAPRRRVIGVAMLLVVVGSLGYSVHETRVDPAQAYFVTGTRVWELAVGAVVALFATRLRNVPRNAAVPIGWAGLVAILVAGVSYTDRTPFPGSAALLPVVGAALVVAAGPAAGAGGPVAVLGWWPLRQIGDWSYSLYLWHWPLLVLAAARIGHDLDTREGLAVVAASFVPGYLSYRYVEEPARRARWSRTPRAALGGWGALGVATLAAALLVVSWRPEVVATDGSLANALRLSESHPRTLATLGAGSLSASPRFDRAGAPHQDDSYYPTPAQLSEITPFGCIAPYQQDRMVTCTLTKGTREKVVLAGDSHAVQWSRAMARIARASHWQLTMLTKQYCPLARDVAISSPYGRSCSRWQAAASTRLLEDPPDLLVTSQEDYRVLADGKLLGVGAGFQALAASQRSLYRELVDKGTQVVVIRNTPHSGLDVAGCLAKNADDMTKCDVPRAKAIGFVGEAQRESVAGLPGARFVDLDDAICPTRLCAPVIGSVLVFQDANHMTATYGESLAPRLAARIPGAAALPGTS